jgi:penicillin-binding protein 2
MIEPAHDRVPPMTPQLALRVAIVGTCALVMFAIIFFRLWFLQVLSGEQYLKQANVNFTRKILIQPPRGEILDRSGRILVDSQAVPAVLISPPDLPVPISLAGMIARHDHPPGADARLFNRLAHVLGVSTAPVRCKVDGKRPPPDGTLGTFRMSPIACLVAQQVANVPYANVTIKTDVPKDVYYYLSERQTRFPGVDEQQEYIRTYPLHDIAAQLFGTVGPISQPELGQTHFKGVNRQAVVGQSGLEYAYDQTLRGAPGYKQVRVNSLGQFQGYGVQQRPVPGQDLKLSIDLKLQQVGQEALATSIGRNAGSGGAFVAMDPTNGQILAMGSNPTFDPNIFTHPISKAAYDALNNASSGYPLINRAIQSAGPTGSTFKPITATAALQSGVWSVGDAFDDTGQYCLGAGFCLHNAGHAVDGVLNLERAIQVSSDDFFYNLGAKLNADPYAHPNGGQLQWWARAFGIGRSSGIDLPGAYTGTLPTPRWRAHRNLLETECDNATGPFKGKPKHSPGGCGYADGSNRPWSVGDNVNLAVGQGDVQVTPLQLAVAYAALANGGTVVRPHVGLDVQAANGTVLQKVDPPPVRHIHIDPLYLDTIRAGLRAAASQPGGTSYDVMGNFPEQVYGKTGTAQYTGQNDYSWYACFVPPTATTRPIVVVVHVERGGFGDVAAAPVARQILSQWFFGKPGPYTSGSSATL